MAKQAEAERERRAKVINAQGELQASATLSEAARVMSDQPGGAAAAFPSDGHRNRGGEQFDYAVSRCPSSCSAIHGGRSAGGQCHRSGAASTAPRPTC